MPSIFISAKSTPKVFPLSFAVLERYYQALNDIPMCSQESALTIGFRDTYPLFRSPGAASDWEIPHMLTIAEVVHQPEKVAGSNSKLMASYAKFLSEMPLDVSLVAMCGYDYAKADYLFNEVDCLFVKKLLSSWSRGKLEVARSMFEGALYGGGSKLEGETAEFVKGGAENIEEAKRMGHAVATDKQAARFAI
jgi:hypothetical protein